MVAYSTTSPDPVRVRQETDYLLSVCQELLAVSAERLALALECQERTMTAMGESRELLARLSALRQ